MQIVQETKQCLSIPSESKTAKYSLFLPCTDKDIIEATFIFSLILIDVVKPVSVAIGVKFNFCVLATYDKAHNISIL